MSAAGRFETVPMTAPHSEKPARKPANANIRVAAMLGLLTLGMIGLSFAAVPLYRIFCQATGYDGTPRRAPAASSTSIDRDITVRFDASVSSALGWKFQPAQRALRLKIGENGLAFFTADLQHHTGNRG